MTAPRKQLLMLVHRVPYPPNRGDRIRSYHLLKHLAADFDVHLATLSDEPVPDETLTALGRLCRRVAIAPVMGLTRWMQGTWSLASGRTATEGLFRSAELSRTVKQWGDDTEFDAAFVFCSSMLQYLNTPELKDVRTVADLVDVDSQKWFDYAEHASGPKQWLFRLEGRRLRALEQQAVERAAAVTLVSEAEASLFRRVYPNDKTVAVPNGVDLDYFQPASGGPDPWAPLPERDRTNLVFVGALDYRANIDGITWFAREVWPLLRREMPQLSLGLVGRNPAPAVKQLAQTPGIRVFGTVPDVRPYVAAADIVIAPLRIARGIQNKVLEAMAMGKPVVCSSAALEGLSAVAGEDLLVAEAPHQWLSAISHLTEDRRLADSIGASGRQFARTEHRWDANMRLVTDLLAPATAPWPAPALALTAN